MNEKIGLFAGGVLVITGQMHIIIELQDSFANLFFVVLLAPIIFEGAYTLQKVNESCLSYRNLLWQI